MARATHLTIGTADRIRLDAGSNENDYDEDGRDGIRQEVQVSITYVLDASDTDLTLVAEEKAGEVQRAHEAAWNRIGVLGGRACDCRSDRSGFEEDDGGNEGPEDGPQNSGPPPGLPPAAPPAGAWYLPGGSRTGGETGQPAPEAQPDAEPATGPQKILIRCRAGNIGLTAYALESLLYQQFKVWRVERLTKVQAASLLVALERDLKEPAAKDRERKERETPSRNGIHGSPATSGGGRAA